MPKSQIAVDMLRAYSPMASPLSREVAIKDIAEQLIRQMLLMIEPVEDGELREGLCGTPRRVVKSWIELFAGYAQDPKKILGTTFMQEGYKYDQIILCKNIEMYSTCEHHMLPFYGHAHVAYIPNDRVVGLSKLARLVECFARRLQIQEKLTEQIAQAIEEVLQPKGVAVIIEAKHHCMCSRGASKQHSAMTTSALRGVFKTKTAARAELMTLIGA